MMQRKVDKKQKAGFAPMMKVEDIVDTLATLQVKPAVTAAMLEEPTAETALGVLMCLCEFAYDYELVAIKRCLAECCQHPESYHESSDTISVFYMARQLCSINGFHDFSATDIWDPQRKRLRTIISSLVNFCRYKTMMVQQNSGVREECERVEQERDDLFEKRTQLLDQLQRAEELHDQEQPLVWEAEELEEETRKEFDKRMKAKNVADQEIEDAEQKVNERRERLDQHEEKGRETRSEIQDLKSRIAQNPEGLELEIDELEQSIRQWREKLEDQGERVGLQTQRVQVLESVGHKIQVYTKSLQGVQEISEMHSAASGKVRASKEEANRLSRRKLALESTLQEAQQREAGLASDIKKGAEDFEVNKQEFETRRQQAVRKKGEISSKYAEEQATVQEEQSQIDQLRDAIVQKGKEHEQDMLQIVQEKVNLDSKLEAWSRDFEQMLIEADHELGIHTRLSGGAAGCGALGMTPNPKKTTTDNPDLSAAKQGLEQRRLEFE